MLKPLIYPFTYQQWLTHPSSRKKIKWCKKVGAELNKQRKYGTQLNLKL